LFAGSIGVWRFWPAQIFQGPWIDHSALARFHTIGAGVGFSSQNQNQLIANVYFQNDAGDADVVVYSASGAAITTSGGPDQAVIVQLRKIVADFVREAGGLHFTVRSKEGRWFTIVGPVLSIDQVQAYNKGELTFYFVSTMLINEQGTVRSMDNCSFVAGSNPTAIIQCPS